MAQNTSSALQVWNISPDLPPVFQACPPRRAALRLALQGVKCVHVQNAGLEQQGEMGKESLQQVRMSWDGSDGIACKGTIHSQGRRQGKERFRLFQIKRVQLEEGEGYNAGGKTKNRGVCYKGKSGAGGQNKLEHAENVLHQAMDLYFWKITEVSSRGAVLMGLEKIPEQVLKGPVFLWLVSTTEDSSLVFGAQSPPNSEEHSFSCRHLWAAQL